MVQVTRALPGSSNEQANEASRRSSPSTARSTSRHLGHRWSDCFCRRTAWAMEGVFSAASARRYQRRDPSRPVETRAVGEPVPPLHDVRLTSAPESVWTGQIRPSLGRGGGLSGPSGPSIQPQVRISWSRNAPGSHSRRVCSGRSSERAPREASRRSSTNAHSAMRSIVAPFLQIFDPIISNRRHL